ncbi:MAG: hypothetical protein AAFV53_00260 [Myxococcota bacterium]
MRPNIIGRDSATIERPHSSPAGDTRLPASQFRSERFTLFHFPDSWVWHDEHGFMPDIGRINHNPGGNGVEGIPGQVPNAAGAMLRIQQKGGRILPVGEPALGEWQFYLCHQKTNLGMKTGKHFCFVGDAFEILGRRGARQLDRSASWWAFVKYYRDESELCPEMPHSSYTDILDVEGNRLDRLRNKANPVPEKINAQKARIEAMKAEWARMGGEEVEPTVLEMGEVEMSPTPVPQLPVESGPPTAGPTLKKKSSRSSGSKTSKTTEE